jgi:hypothetical protein
MALGFEAALTGDWSRATRVLAVMSQRMRDSQVKALREEAQAVRLKIIDGINGQAPAGRPLKPLSPYTLAMRQFVGIKGDKTLIERGDLLRCIEVHDHGRDSVCVGVPEHAMNSEGRSLVRIATINEYGADYFLRLTDRMRKYLAMVFRKAGMPDSGGGTGTKEFIHVVIPPRPFLGPVFERYVHTADFETRVSRRLLASFTGIG